MRDKPDLSVDTCRKGIKHHPIWPELGQFALPGQTRSPARYARAVPLGAPGGRRGDTAGRDAKTAATATGSRVAGTPGKVLPYGVAFFARADASRVSRIHSDLDLLAASAAVSISRTSDASSRQNSRSCLEAPSGSVGLPIFGFFGIGWKSLLYAHKVVDCSPIMPYCTHINKNKVRTNMTTTPQAPVSDSETRGTMIPENAHLRESSSPVGMQTRRIVEVAFAAPSTPFRESSPKPPRRVANAERRSREFLTPAEVESLMTAAEGQGRHGHRDGTMILIAYRHGLRVSELCSLRWDQVDFGQGVRACAKRSELHRDSCFRLIEPAQIQPG